MLLFIIIVIIIILLINKLLQFPLNDPLKIYTCQNMI